MSREFFSNESREGLESGFDEAGTEPLAEGWLGLGEGDAGETGGNLWTEVVLTEKRMQSLSDWFEALEDDTAEGSAGQDSAIHLAAVDGFCW